jgi:tetratricopeptide (TPR) repeat protein
VWVDGDAMLDVVHTYEIVGYPCVMFATPEGGSLFKIEDDGRNTAARLLAAMKKATQEQDIDREKLNSLIAAVKLRPDDIRARYALGEYYIGKHLYKESDEQFEKVLALDPKDEKGFRAAAYWYLLRTTTKRAVDNEAEWQRVVRYIDEAGKTIKREDAQELVMYYELLHAVHGLGDVSAAGQIAAKMQAKFPSGKLAKKASDIAVRVKHYGTDKEPIDP